MKKEHHARHVIEMPSPHPTTTKEEFKVLQYVGVEFSCRVKGVEFSCFVKYKVKSKYTVYSQSTKITSRNLPNLNPPTCNL